MTGLFEVQRYDFHTRCPCLEDIDLELADHMTSAFSQDLESSGYCEPSQTETETTTDSVLDESYEHQLGAIDINDHPTFVVVLTKAHIQCTLNNLWVGVQCTFQLVEVGEVQFDVTFKR
ncbi:hypothetical protein SASPL_108451 [Salvia splendens]|uniref:Uncharacterized protein n=1 Tax=Salvia splendens TaxID=180675 RepID=A0A8X8YD40_SALSN|nr:hypothetical protein SASPL_108451 [Salvia splendens]